MDNRRIHQRFDTSLSVEIYTGRGVIPAHANNLSQGGLGITLDVPLPVQAQVGLSMFLVEEGIEDERTAPLNVVGQVCWCNQEPSSGRFQAGIRFAQIQAAEVERLGLFLARLRGGA
jgi:hypothetical protein